jgi:hypothetical protein
MWPVYLYDRMPRPSVFRAGNALREALGLVTDDLMTSSSRICANLLR